MRAKFSRRVCFGHLMEGVLQAHKDKLSGVVNGIDEDTWNPAIDPIIERHYSFDDMRGKHACKRTLQRMFGLPVDPFAPLMAIGSRITGQKFADVVLEALRVCSTSIRACSSRSSARARRTSRRASGSWCSSIRIAWACTLVMTSAARTRCMRARTFCCTAAASSLAASRNCMRCAIARCRLHRAWAVLRTPSSMPAKRARRTAPASLSARRHV